MASRLDPNLDVRGQAREALELDRSVSGGDTAIRTSGELGDPPTGSEATVSLSGDDADALRSCWERLSADGAVLFPLERQRWGDELGRCRGPVRRALVGRHQRRLTLHR
ncbi:MAG: hypothetical protein ACRYG2_01725 [Janthinobacterium lividum]